MPLFLRFSTMRILLWTKSQIKEFILGIPSGYHTDFHNLEQGKED
jgi:hypothetical protein